MTSSGQTAKFYNCHNTRL